VTYRAALIGCGKIGSEFSDDPRVQGIFSHAGAYAACQRTALVAVCDADPVKRERCGDRWNVGARYSDARQLLRSQAPEIVSICTPDSNHFEMIRLCLHSGSVRAILAEKPLALSLPEAEELVQCARQQGVALAVNYTRRYAASHIALKQFLAAGGIGAIQAVSGYYTKGVCHNGTHWFDLARYLVGEIVEVKGLSVCMESSDDPTLDVTLGFETGARGYLHGCDAEAFSVFEMDLVGTEGRVRVTDSGHQVERYSVADSPHYTGYRSLIRQPDLAGGLNNVLLNAVEDLVACLERSGEPLCSGEDGLAALKVACAARQTASEPIGRRVKSL
jgi:predicted dehydrogenase